ncbi:hypothetical protein BC835DRAFT_361028 [Cytidiella melzeri]|nr:hypothetical protein BC835DRAFT_361028 [Cytidiella melzeri]
MAATLVFRPSDDEEATFLQLIQSTQDYNPLPVRGLEVLETRAKCFGAAFVDQCRQVAERPELQQSFASVVAFSASFESDIGFRSAWYLIPLLVLGLTDVRLQFGRHLSCTMLRSFFNFVSGQLEGQTRFSRVRTMHIDIAIDHLDAGDRLNLVEAILKACRAAPFLQRLAVPVDVLAVAWDAFFTSVSYLPELSELAFYPGKLVVPFPVDGRRTSYDKMEQLRTLSINAPLAFCANVVDALSSSLARLNLEFDGLRTRSEMTDAFTTIRSSCVDHRGPVQLLSPLADISSPSPSAVSSMFRVRGLPAPVMVSSLTHLDIKVTRGKIDSTDLTALFTLRGMQSFSLSCPSPLLYGKETIADMLSCWPAIQSLSLNPRPSSGLGLGLLPPLAILADVARCGQSLRKFCACLDGFSMVDLADLNRLRSWHVLRELNLGSSVGPMDGHHIEQTLDYILALFNSLEMISVEDEGGEAWSTALAFSFKRRL